MYKKKNRKNVVQSNGRSVMRLFMPKTLDVTLVPDNTLWMYDIFMASFAVTSSAATGFWIAATGADLTQGKTYVVSAVIFSAFALGSLSVAIYVRKAMFREKVVTQYTEKTKK